MAQYVDGFLLPIPRNRLSDYQRVAEKVADVWKEYGALEYCENVGDDLNREGTLAFTNVVDANKDEVIIFGWVVFESKQARDLANKKVAADPRMVELIEPLIEPENPVFDAGRMAYGGFRTLVQSSKVKLNKE